MKLLGNKKLVAIDYDRREVRLVVFEYVRKAPAILALHTFAAPETVDVTDPQVMGAVLRTLIDTLHLRGASALMCLGRSQAVLKSLQLPAASSDNELASMVQFQVNKELPFSADEAVVDFTHAEHFDVAEAETGGEGPAVLAAAVRLAAIDAARAICETAGLKLQRLGLRPYANLRAVYRCVRSKPGERILLVNVTADEAEIDVMRDEMLEFSRAATVASVAPTAERSAAVRSVVTEVTRSLQSFVAMQRGGEINACLVAGATGIEEQIVASLAKRLNVPCEMFDPSRGFALRMGEGLSAFGAALGLAAGQAADALPFDFVNPKRPAPPRDTRKTRALAIAGGVVVFLAVVGLARHSYLAKRQEVVSELQKRNKKLDEKNKGLKNVKRRMADIDTWQGADINWLDQLAHLSNSLPGADRVYLTALRCNSGNGISLTGRLRDNRDISNFAKQQMALPGYEVLPRGTSPARDQYGYGMQFRMDMVVLPKAEPIIQTSRAVGRPADDVAGRPEQRSSQGTGSPARRAPRRRPNQRRRTR